MMTFLQTNGYKAICWFTPFIDTSSDNPECYENCYYDVCMNENFGTASNYPTALASNYFVNVCHGGVHQCVIASLGGKGRAVRLISPTRTRCNGSRTR